MTKSRGPRTEPSVWGAEIIIAFDTKIATGKIGHWSERDEVWIFCL